MTAAGVACVTCGTELRENAKFCDECGAAVSAAVEPAEYKQVTVLFADVVHSMDIAAAGGAERLREIMTELVNRAALVVQRFGGTVDKFTATGSWRCSARQSPWRTTHFAPAWRRCVSRRKSHD
jgi:adenylate cyclase